MTSISFFLINTICWKYGIYCHFSLLNVLSKWVYKISIQIPLSFHLIYIMKLLTYVTFCYKFGLLVCVWGRFFLAWSLSRLLLSPTLLLGAPWMFLRIFYPNIDQKLCHTLEKVHKKETRMIDSPKKITHGERLYEPVLLSLNKRAGNKSKENLQHAAAKVREYCLFVVMVNWTKHSEPKLPKWKKWKVWRAEIWNVWQCLKTCQISILENFSGGVKWHLQRGGKWSSEISFTLLSMIP